MSKKDRRDNGTTAVQLMTTVPISGFISLLRLSAFAIWILRIIDDPRSEVTAISLAPIIWNSSNPMFKSSKNDHVIEVNPYDDLDFVCPHIDALHHKKEREEEEEEGGGGGEKQLEDEEDEYKNAYYVIYMVSKSEYKDCNIYSQNGATMMLNCSNPRHRKRFTVLFEPFPSIPNVPEYHPGSSYYFISTSTGARQGLGNLHQGACAHHNMKITVQICCNQHNSNSNHSFRHTNAILSDHSSSSASIQQRRQMPISDRMHHNRSSHHSIDVTNRRRSRISAHGGGDSDEYGRRHRMDKTVSGQSSSPSVPLRSVHSFDLSLKSHEMIPAVPEIRRRIQTNKTSSHSISANSAQQSQSLQSQGNRGNRVSCTRCFSMRNLYCLIPVITLLSIQRLTCTDS